MHDLLPERADQYISRDAAGHERKPRGIPECEGVGQILYSCRDVVSEVPCKSSNIDLALISAANRLEICQIGASGVGP